MLTIIEEAWLHYAEDAADYQVASYRLQDPTDEIIDEAELRKRMAISS